MAEDGNSPGGRPFKMDRPGWKYRASDARGRELVESNTKDREKLLICLQKY